MKRNKNRKRNTGTHRNWQILKRVIFSRSTKTDLSKLIRINYKAQDFLKKSELK